MGLDVYVGPWIRYYRGDWLTVTQQAAARLGVPAGVVLPGPDGKPVLRPAGPPDDAPTPAQIREAISVWRKGFAAKLEDRAGSLVEWDESATGEYQTDKPDWDGFDAVRYLAAHEQFPWVRLPKVMEDGTSRAVAAAIDDAYADPDRPRPSRWFRTSRDERPTACFDHLLRPLVWVPVEFASPVQFVDLGTRPMPIGSVFRFREELRLLNERTLNLDEAAMARASNEGPARNGSFKWSARFGLSVLLPLLDWAVERRQPIIVDF
jgi:hypothetical protein